MLRNKHFAAPAIAVIMSMSLAACGTTATPTSTTAPAASPSAMMVASPSAMMAGDTPSAMMAASPSAMMGETPSAMMSGSPSAMMGETPSAMMSGSPSAMMGETPSAMMGGAGSGSMAPITVKMLAKNGSGEDGTAIITPKGDADVTVSLSLTGSVTDAQPVHIHKGSCANLDPNPLYPLTNVVGGKSDTEVMVPMSELAKGDYAINVHKSAAAIGTYVSCGDIVGSGMMGGTPGMMSGSPTAMMSGTPGGGMVGGGSTGSTMDPSKVGQELVDAMAGKYKGTKVTMFGPFSSDDEVKFNNSKKDFEAKTGITIQYEGSKEFETTINVRVEGGNPPDIADFPQPGLMASIAKSGKIQDVSKWINAAWLSQEYNKGYLDTATAAGPNGPILGGVFQRVNAKGLVWYPKKAFDAAGYKTPTTWAEQQTLMDKIVADGDTPWCIGIESGTATGWPATDWVENIMLRTTSPENYDKWTQGTLPFTSPEVKHAVDLMSQIWTNDKYVYGGRRQIVSTAFGDASKPMFLNPPKCWLENQGNFITSFFPKDAKAGVDYDFYYLPPIDTQYGKPMEFGGDLMSAFNDRPEVRAVMQWFSTYDGVKGWVTQGGALAPQKDSNLADYATDNDRKVAQTLLGATVVRFDGSDLMPGAVGAGTFWRGMTDYISGTANEDQALQEIQAGWATVKK